MAGLVKYHARQPVAAAATAGCEVGWVLMGLPKPALGENGTSVPLAISSQRKDHLPDESCMMSAAQTSFVSGDPPIINNLGLFGSATPGRKTCRPS